MYSRLIYSPKCFDFNWRLSVLVDRRVSMRRTTASDLNFMEVVLDKSMVDYEIVAKL